ncbi:MAG: DUF790 family protein [Planctomycetota bacterium]|nr:DUF790 family protein [Planctomycetota bacterium]
MLTKDLVRTKRDGKRIVPLFLKATPAVRAVCEDLLLFWREGLGKTRGELLDQVTPILYRARSLVMSRGLQKLTVDACRFTDPANAAEMRWQALTASARVLAQPAASAAAHQATVASELGLAVPELDAGLYADLPQEARLESAPDWSADALIARYNMSLVQGLVLRCAELELTVIDDDVGRRRQLLKNLRFQRLLAELRGSGEELRMRISGPGSVLAQASRYGLQLANFVPAITGLKQWRLRAEIAGARGGVSDGGILELSHEDGLQAVNRFLAYQPEELRELVAALHSRAPELSLREDGELLVVPGGELVAPDLRLERGTAAPIRIELFHRWHRHALARRLDQLAAGAAPELVLGIDRSLAKLKEVVPLLEHPMAVQRSFLFSGYPTASALRKLAKA